MNGELLTIQPVADQSTLKPWADWVGMIASIGCAIHCAAMPMVLAYLPALGLSWLADEGFHKWMAVICFALAASAFVPGWRKHGSPAPAMWGAAGLLLLTTAAFGLEGACCTACSTEPPKVVSAPACSNASCTACPSGQVDSAAISETGSTLALLTPFVTPMGGLLLVVGHVTNHRKGCRCQGNRCCTTTEEAKRE